MNLLRLLPLVAALLLVGPSMMVEPVSPESVPSLWLGSARAEDCLAVDPETGDVSVEPENCTRP